MLKPINSRKQPWTQHLWVLLMQHRIHELVAIVKPSSLVMVDCVCGTEPAAISIYQLVSVDLVTEKTGSEEVKRWDLTS